MFDLQLIDLVPPSIKHDSTIINICKAIQPQIDEVREIISNKILFTQLETLDDVVLDCLLQECGFNQSVEMVFIQKREDKIRFIQNYVQLKRIKGTKDGVIYAINLVGEGHATIREWFEYGGDPFTFIIDIDGYSSFTLEQLMLINELVNVYKNVRSWFSFNIIERFESSIYSCIIPYQNIKIES